MTREFLLPFEKPLAELSAKIEELRSLTDIDLSTDTAQLEKKLEKRRLTIYKNLTPWQKVQIARHPQRPYTRDYIDMITEDFTELHGDRIHRDDRAIIGGFATLGDRRVMVIGTQKGRDTASNLECNFGSPYPEGYRKALRLMKLASKFNLPIISFIDTSGAYPGIESEERHIAEAIAVNLRESFDLRVPYVACVIGEGGSGGALGIGIGNRLLILEHSYYSVISPEGCAAILWSDRSHAEEAATAMKLTAQELHAAGLVDEILPEPLGGAHRDIRKTAETLKQGLLSHLEELSAMTPTQLKEDRYEKYRAIGSFSETIVDPKP